MTNQKRERIKIKFMIRGISCKRFKKLYISFFFPFIYERTLLHIQVFSQLLFLFQALKDLYTHLTPIQRVSIARHPNRPTFLDHVFNITEKVYYTLFSFYMLFIAFLYHTI